MRTIFLTLALALVAFAQQNEPPKKARLEGSVVSSAGAAIPRAQVRLTGVPSATDSATPPAPVNLSATSDDAGKFAIENIEPGRNYQLNAQRPGFVNARYGARSPSAPGSPLTLDSGADLKGLVITMTPQGVISGRITDLNGDPVQGALIAILRRGYQRGVRQLVPQNTLQSNDQGEYRAANLVPGRYYVMAADRRGLDDAQGAGRTGNINTYYPNATDAQAAVPLEITPGAELRGIDIRFRQGRMYSIRGKLADAGAAVNVSIQAMPKEGAANQSVIAQLTQSAAAARPPDFAFELRNLVPGTYYVLPRMQVPVNGANTVRMGAPVEVTIANEDVTNLAITVGAGVVLTGTVTYEGGDLKTLATASGQNTDLLAAAAAAGVIINAPGVRPTLTLLPPGVATTVGAQIGEDGKFRLEGVPARFYNLFASGFPAGSYLKSARTGGRDVLRDGVDLSSGAATEIAVVVSSKAGNISGSVRDDKAESLAGLMVTLWSKDPEPGSTTNGTRTAYSDQKGAFQFRNLPPGDYFTAAWEEADTGLVQNRDFLAMFSNEAGKVTLTESGQGTIEAKIISTEKIKAAEAKLP